MEKKNKQPITVGTYNKRQLLYVRYFTAILIDLLVLNFFDEYWNNIVIESFTISVLIAILLQILLKFTIKIEHSVADYFKSKPGKLMKFMRYFSAWAILFVSKLVILEAVNMTFGDKVQFKGAWHGVIAFIVVVMTMLIAELIASKINKKLGKIG
ncbi:MAG: hypothetical protein U9R57_04445 [Thermodesulfobacteriota bacterium]|nr:hypothetical protein [Thermodesulfobacteriota bacterium]